MITASPIFSLPSERSGRMARFANDTGEAGEHSRLLDRTASEGYIEPGASQYGTTHSDPSEYGGWTKKTSLWAKAKYYVPSLYWIPNYSLSYVGGDLLAGVTVAAMLIPQSVSYASSLAKLNPVTGLFSASIPPIIYALLGTSRQLNVAPEAALSLLVGQAVSDVLHGDPHAHPKNPDAVAIAVCTAIVAQVGVISFLLGFFRLGFLDVVLSRALLRGFITAVAFVIFLEQLMPMLGLVALEHKLNPQTTLDKIRFILENGFTHFHKQTAMVSFGALLVLVGARVLKASFRKYWFIYRIPEVLVVVVVSTILSGKLHWDEDGIDILGSVSVKTGGHFFKFPLHHSHLPYYKQTTSYAVLISIIGFLDSIVAAKQNASRFGYSISPNRELVALGAANLVGSFVPGTLPAYGSITRSRINADVGGRTQMASIFCAAIILLATFFLLPWLYYLPKCVLGSIICLVVFSLLAETPEDVHYYWKMRAWIDLLLMTLTFVLTIVWSVQVGVVVSMVISLLLVVRRSSKPRMTILGRIRGTDRWKPVDETTEAEEDIPGTLIVRIRENLDFANSAQLKERLRRLELYGLDPSHPSEEPRRQQAQVLIFHMSDVGTCDASAVQIFYELFEEYKKRGVDVYITHMRPDPRRAFERAGIDELLGEDAFYDDVATAVSRIASGADLQRFVDA
ncbi:sulfate anion transporter [Amylostereum chailletii]|nr:sulfate anion transporter [Amylostereum chailletii]